MTSALGRSLESVLKNIQLNDILPLDDNVPIDPSQFYSSFGYLQHPLTRKPVKQLAPYQLKVWNTLLEKSRVMVVKTHKCGLSTSQLLADFQLAILPSSNPLSCRGFDQLVISQTKDLAKEHLRSLRRMILRSNKYRNFLMDKPVEIDESNDSHLKYRSVMKDEKSKTAVIYIRNPEDETRPSRIIALGADNPGAIESWSNIHHIHISDLVATIGDYSESLNVALTRLANTRGSLVIETIPDFAGSALHKMFENPGDFIPIRITADEAVAAGVISAEHLASERERLGPLYSQYYGAEFATSGNVWYDETLFEYDNDSEDEVTL